MDCDSPADEDGAPSLLRPDLQDERAMGAILVRQRLDAGWCLALLLLALAWLIQADDYGKEPMRMVLASAVVILGSSPLLVWMFRVERGAVPVFQLHCFFYALCFGFVAFFPDASTLQRPVAEKWMQQGLWAAMLALAGMLCGFEWGRRVFQGLRPMACPFPIPTERIGQVGTVVAPCLFVGSMAFEFLGVPYLDQIVAVCWLFVFLFLSASWFAGQLRGLALGVYLAFLLPLNLLAGLSSGHIAAFVMTAVVLGILTLSIRRRVPWWWVVIVGAVFIVLQPVKARYRALVWEQGVQLGLVEGVKTFLELGVEELTAQSPVSDQTPVRDAVEKTVERINHLHVTGAVIRDTPQPQPYRQGATYAPLLTKWIPRMLWPGKPEERLGNEWAQDYGYLGRKDFQTSFNLPWLPEAFINFGWWGVAGVNLIVGVFFALLHRLFLDRPGGLAGLAFGLAVTSSLMFVESNLSLMVGRLLIGLISLFLIGWGLRRWFPAENLKAQQ